MRTRKTGLERKPAGAKTKAKAKAAATAASDEDDTDDIDDDDDDDDDSEPTESEDSSEHFISSDEDLGDPDHSADGRRGKRIKREPEHVLVVASGVIEYYPCKGDKPAHFLAKCNCHGGRCERERKAEPGKRACVGRPLGFKLQ